MSEKVKSKNSLLCDRRMKIAVCIKKQDTAR